MNLSKVQEIYDSPSIDSEINLGGWVRAFRANKFIELNDGSTIKNIQPPRGFIYDRNYKLLVGAEQAYDIMILPKAKPLPTRWVLI